MSSFLYTLFLTVICEVYFFVVLTIFCLPLFVYVLLALGTTTVPLPIFPKMVSRDVFTAHTGKDFSLMFYPCIHACLIPVCTPCCPPVDMFVLETLVLLLTCNFDLSTFLTTSKEMFNQQLYPFLWSPLSTKQWNGMFHQWSHYNEFFAFLHYKPIADSKLKDPCTSSL